MHKIQSTIVKDPAQFKKKKKLAFDWLVSVIDLGGDI
jgi:hypothetical protein